MAPSLHPQPEKQARMSHFILAHFLFRMFLVAVTLVTGAAVLHLSTKPTQTGQADAQASSSSEPVRRLAHVPGDDLPAP
jgi:hypothetical protein